MDQFWDKYPNNHFNIKENLIPFQSTVCERIMQAVLDQPEVEGHRQIISLSQDSFYRELNEADLKLAKKGHFNFDHPGNKVWGTTGFQLMVPENDNWNSSIQNLD